MITVAKVRTIFQADSSSVTDAQITAIFPHARADMKLRMGKEAYDEYKAMTTGEDYEELQLAEAYYAAANLVQVIGKFSTGKIMSETSNFGTGNETGKSLSEIMANTADRWISSANNIIDAWLVNRTDDTTIGNKSISMRVI